MKKVLLLFILAGILLLMVSYGEYRQVTIRHEIGSYTFEYPSRYNKTFRDVCDWKMPFTNLILDGPVKIEKIEVFDADSGKIRTVTGRRGTVVIEVTITNYKVYYGESYDASFRISKQLEGASKWTNYKLLNRSPVVVSEIEGEMIEYLTDKLMPIPVEDGKNLEYSREVYFDYNGMVWSINATSNEDIRDQVIAEFNHIIETFRILD